MKISKLNIPNIYNYCKNRQIKTIAELFQYNRLKYDLIKKNKKDNKLAFPELTDFVYTLINNDIFKLQKKYKELLKYLIYDIFHCLKNVEINSIYNIINSNYGVNLNKLTYTIINLMIKNDYITQKTINDKTLYVAKLKGITPLCLNIKFKQIFEYKLDGLSNKEITLLTNYNKQYIHTILSTEINILNNIDEYKYYYLFSKYKMTFEQFLITFNLDKNNKYNLQIFNYLNFLCYNNKIKTNKKNFNKNMLKDININDKEYKYLEEYFNNKYLEITNDNKFKTINNNDILSYVIDDMLKINNEEYLNIDDVINKYNEVFNNLNIYSIKPYTARTLYNKLINSYFFITSENKKIRRYNTLRVNINDAFKNIDFNKYKNKKISVSVFLNDDNDLLLKLKLNNIYELHNVLRKTFKRINTNLNIKIVKTPNIIIYN